MKINSTAFGLLALGTMTFFANWAHGAEIIVDNLDAGFAKAGDWTPRSKTGQYGSDMWYGGKSNPGATTYATWTATIPTTGTWAVEMWWPTQNSDSWCEKGYVSVDHADGSTDTFINQTTTGARWLGVGFYEFNAGQDAVVTLNTATDDDGFAAADAVRFTDVLDGTTFAYKMGGWSHRLTGTWTDNRYTDVDGSTAHFEPGAYLPDGLYDVEFDYQTHGNRNPATVVQVWDGPQLLLDTTVDQRNAPAELGTHRFDAGDAAVEVIAPNDNVTGDDYTLTGNLEFVYIPEPNAGLLLLLCAVPLLRRR